MEIKTCEEYVLNELNTLQEKLTKVNEENEELKEDEKPNHCNARPADVKWEKYHDLEIQLEELRRVIVSQAIELYKLKYIIDCQEKKKRGIW